jgi:hypothetical protein
MEIETDLEFQRRVWRVPRVGWLIIGAAVVAALLGLFGTGPLSRASTDGGGLTVEYDRFARREQTHAAPPCPAAIEVRCAGFDCRPAVPAANLQR